MVSIQGVDFSRTPNSNWAGTATALKIAGKRFVGRYAVTDKSPLGRGITAAEFAAYQAGGIETFLYWEANEAWMLGGFQAGANAARNALANIRAAGMPEQMPVYYSHDIEPNPAHYEAVDQCLRGAASIVGFDAVGLYGGLDIIKHVAETSKTAKWFCQTYAWSRGLVSRYAHLYQYNNYGNIIAGIDVDLVEARTEKYGQASSFIERVYPSERIPAPDKMTAQGFTLERTETARFKCIQGGMFKTGPSDNAPNATPTGYKANQFYTFDYQTKFKIGGKRWLVSKQGSWAPIQNFVLDDR